MAIAYNRLAGEDIVAKVVSEGEREREEGTNTVVVVRSVRRVFIFQVLRATKSSAGGRKFSANNGSCFRGEVRSYPVLSCPIQIAVNLDYFSPHACDAGEVVAIVWLERSRRKWRWV